MRSRTPIVAAAFALALSVVAAALPASADPLTPTRLPVANCMDYMAPGAGRRALYDWRDTLNVEHCDRIKRLWNIASLNSYGAPPQFFDGQIAARDLPADIRVDMPLLRVVFPERVFFDTARSELRPEAREVVRIVARNLQLEPPDVVLFVAGHTDHRGDREYNQRLSAERANAVADAILAEGVNVAKVWRVGFGEDMPLRAGESEDELGENRRVEFLFAARADAVAIWLADAQIDMLCQGRSSAEMNACVRRLDLRTDYVAVQTNQRVLGMSGERERVRLDLQGTERITINPVNRSIRRVEPD